ncbi:hypothetical protein MPC4_30069 [Methylocella tundrae]|uniref:Uncharacterized protein n=1 Tax=Methylocella tundrae TaxID=227605 RepID=A0A8B6M990_METTU|nr:hypothetical protein MPC1_1160005 [Methylocella tundrae]VTZ50885.1 hypothetical protein MPC4_30069 [Methylocella tundrae]
MKQSQAFGSIILSVTLAGTSFSLIQLISLTSLLSGVASCQFPSLQGTMT